MSDTIYFRPVIPLLLALIAGIAVPVVSQLRGTAEDDAATTETTMVQAAVDHLMYDKSYGNLPPRQASAIDTACLGLNNGSTFWRPFPLALLAMGMLAVRRRATGRDVLAKLGRRRDADRQIRPAHRRANKYSRHARSAENHRSSSNTVLGWSSTPEDATGWGRLGQVDTPHRERRRI